MRCMQLSRKGTVNCKEVNERQTVNYRRDQLSRHLIPSATSSATTQPAYQLQYLHLATCKLPVYTFIFLLLAYTIIKSGFVFTVKLDSDALGKLTFSSKQLGPNVIQCK